MCCHSRRVTYHILAQQACHIPYLGTAGVSHTISWHSRHVSHHILSQQACLVPYLVIVLAGMSHTIYLLIAGTSHAQHSICCHSCCSLYQDNALCNCICFAKRAHALRNDSFARINIASEAQQMNKVTQCVHSQTLQSVILLPNTWSWLCLWTWAEQQQA